MFLILQHNHSKCWPIWFLLLKQQHYTYNKTQFHLMFTATKLSIAKMKQQVQMNNTLTT